MASKFGGRMTCRLSSGALISLRGTLTLNPSGQSNEVITNQDGSISAVGTPQARRADFSFEDGGIDYDALMKSDPFNVTFAEEFTGVTHYFTTAIPVGDPSVNRINGEVSGFSIASEGYRKTKG